jgi:hypothetical protein
MTDEDLERLARKRSTPFPARPPVLEGNPGSAGEWTRARFELRGLGPDEVVRAARFVLFDQVDDDLDGDRTDPE